MSELNQVNKQYDDIPIIYCKSCLSLKIGNFLSESREIIEEEGTISDYDYCEDCGSTNLETCNIQEYEELYKQRYGHSPLETF